MNITRQFGYKRFLQWAGCKVKNYGSPWIKGPDLSRLTDHGFIVDAACVWSDGALEGHEIAIIARTYCSNEEIDNPPDGLRCWRLPMETMGDGDIGTPIAMVIESPSAYAEDFLKMCGHLPAMILAYAIPKKLVQQGYGVMLRTNRENGINPKILKLS